MEEIIGRRKNSLAIGYIAVIVVGAAIAIAGIVLGVKMEETGAIVIGVAVGLVLVLTGVVQCVLFFKTPANIIVYSNGELKLGNKGTCSPLDITACKIIITRRNGIADRWGKVELGLADGRKILLNYVDNVKAVQQRLGTLKEQVYDEMVRAQTRENNSSELPANSGKDPFDI